MRIALVISTLIPERGGAYTFQGEVLRTLSNHIAESNHHFVLFTETETPLTISQKVPVVKTTRNLLEKVVDAGIHFLNRFQDFFWQKRIFGMKSTFQKIMAREKIDLIWFLTPEYQDCDIPYIFTLWDLAHYAHPYFPEVSRDGIWESRHYFFQRALQKASCVIAPGKIGQLQLEELFRIPKHRILTLTHPAPKIDLRSLQGSGSRLPSPYIFYPAQFWPHKNHVILLKALSVLKNNYQIELNLALTGSDKGNEPYIRDLVKEMNLNAQVHFLGFVSQQELYGLYRNALALVYPSFFGPENMPPLEAMQLDCPVIASDIPGAREQMGDAAEFFDPFDPSDLAKILEAFVKNPDKRHSVIEKGKIRAQENSSDSYVKGVFNYLDRFQMICENWPRGTGD